MAASILVQTRIDPALKERAAAVLHHMGLTVSDAVRILLTRIANEGALPFGFASDPVEALDDPRPAISHDEVEAHFARRRAVAIRKSSEGVA